MSRWARPRRAMWAAVPLLVAALALGLPAGNPQAKIDEDAASRELIALTNVGRTSNGFPALPSDRTLATIAKERSEDMIVRRYFSHTIPPDGSTVVDIMESLGVPFVLGSENIAWNNALDFATVPLASEDFMNSPSHRKNVLNGRWHRLGAGVAAGDGRKMYTVVFLELPGSGPVPPTRRIPLGADGDWDFTGIIAPPVAPPRGPPTTDGPVQVPSAPTGLMDSLVNRSLRLFLNL